MAKQFKAPNDVFEAQIDDLFSRHSKGEMELIFQVLSLIIFQSTNNDNLSNLYHSVDLENFVKVLSVFDGLEVKFPSKKKLKDWLLFALCYYYRDIEQMSWDEIKKILPFDISSISYGIKIRNLNKFVLEQMNDLFGATSERSNK